VHEKEDRREDWVWKKVNEAKHYKPKLGKSFEQHDKGGRPHKQNRCQNNLNSFDFYRPCGTYKHNWNNCLFNPKN